MRETPKEDCAALCAAALMIIRTGRENIVPLLAVMKLINYKSKNLAEAPKMRVA